MNAEPSWRPFVYLEPDKAAESASAPCGTSDQLWPRERRSEIRRPSEPKTKTATRRLFEISLAWRATAVRLASDLSASAAATLLPTANSIP